MTANGTASFDAKPTVRGNPIRLLILGGALLVGGIVVATAMTVGVFRERALNSAERELENTVLLLARHFDQQLEDFIVIQKEVANQVQLAKIASPDVFRAQMSAAEMHEALKAKVSGHSDVAGINVFDSDGWLINSSDRWPIPSITIKNRAFFKALKFESPTSPVFIELVRGRFSQGWATVIAYRIEGPNHEFLGFVTRAVTPARFEEFFASLALGENAAISMYHRDGTLLARYPHIDEMIGLNFGTGDGRQRILSTSDHATVRLNSPLDGQDRLASARALSDFPISLVATTTVSAALADWHEQTIFLISVAALSVLLIAVLLYLVVSKLAQQHRLEKQRLDTAINNMPQGLLLFDSSKQLVVCNQGYLDMFDLTIDVVKPGSTLPELLLHRRELGTFKDDVDGYCSTLYQKMAEGNVFQTILEGIDGRSIQALYRPLPDGGWVTTLEDITERKRVEERITHMAHYDALTDLPNRVLFHERLKYELARISDGKQLAVLYIDIDEFKSVNDTLGHMIGDELLKSVAQSLSGCITETNFVARLGGDEFGIVQTAVQNPDDVTDLVARVFDAIRAPYECLGHQVTADASIGIALAPQHGVDLHQILKNADLAMYAAKSAGRRTYRFFEPEMDAQVKARRNLETDLRQAISDGGLEVYYQPCVGLQDNKITGCEALLRWRHSTRGVISPAEFIPIAEETGLINQIGEWVLTTACAEAATWPDHIRIAVNVSPVQFRSGTLALKIVAALAATGLAASRLELEITEAVLIRDDEAALSILHQLRAIGVRIALDDFGTGYSSLSYLQRFPFDKIKIDRCFVNDVEEPDGSSSIIQAVVNIAAARHMTTTAEGVETLPQRELLRALGCSEMQGYLFSPARPAAEIKQMFFPAAKRSAVNA
jgi:diguanylate cyclase (GGDEF)-like protein